MVYGIIGGASDIRNACKTNITNIIKGFPVGKTYSSHWKDWVVYTVRMPPNLKIQLEDMALRRKQFQANIVREALELYFQNHSDSKVEKKAAKIMIRRRGEQLDLEGPKDKYDSLLFPVRVRKYVNRMRGEWKAAGYTMESYLFDELIDFVEEEKEVMAGNPKESTISRMLDDLITELKEEKAQKCNDR